MTGDVEIGGTGDPLVLVHGLATTRAIWRHTAPLLAHTRQVVTVDVPGFGTARPTGWGFDLDDVADRVAESLRANDVREPYDLVGHSMGAAVTLVLAAHHPARVRSLVLVSPAGLRPVPAVLGLALGVAAGMYLPLRRYASPLAVAGLGRRVLLAGGVVDGAELAPAVVRELVGASRGARRTAAALAAVASADLRATLRELPVAVGVVWGSGDRVIPSSGLQAVRALRPDACCEVIGGAGHIAMVERPKAFAAALERVLVAIS